MSRRAGLCRHCGCVTHWEPLKPGTDGHMAVNIRNFEPGLLEGLQLRRFDGAESWSYVEEPPYPAEAVQKRARLFVFSRCRGERSRFFAVGCLSAP